MFKHSRSFHVCAKVSALAVAFGLVAARSAIAAPLATFTFGSAGWATFGLALPTGAASSGVHVGALPTQTDVKTTWPDGSIRFAVVTASIPNAGAFAIEPGSSASHSFSPASLTASVTLTIGGDTYIAALAPPTGDRWLDGPLVVESRAVVAPVLRGVAHPTLRVLFDVRAYATGGHRVDVTVENCVDDARANAVTYDAMITVAGRVVFSQKQVVHGYLARWRRVFLDDVHEASVTPDFAPFVASKAIPSYLATVDDQSPSTSGAQFDILKTGDLHLPMNDHGGRPELAPYPDWTAQYLVHRRPEQRNYVLRHGDLAGSFGIHIREGDGVRLVSIDDHPNFWLDPRADPDGRAQNGLAGQAVVADNAHQPSLAFVPYLVTGDRYYVDEMKFWANFCLLWTYQDHYWNARRGSTGLLETNEVRGIGWALRNLADAAAYLPDADPYRNYFRQKVDNNLEYYEHYATTFQTPLGTLWPGKRPEDQVTKPYTWMATWEQAYVAWAIDRALQLGFTGGAALRDRIARFHLRLFTSASDGFPPAYAGLGVIAVGTVTDGTYAYFSSLGEVLHATGGPTPGAPTPFAGYYGVEDRLMLMVGVRQQWSGAADALKFLMTPTMVQDVNKRSGWAIGG